MLLAQRYIDKFLLSNWNLTPQQFLLYLQQLKHLIYLPVFGNNVLNNIGIL
jgi:hypothetical protein